MDWIVTTGATVEAALDVALDELSVSQEDIEFEVVKEPKNSLFGFRRKQAQVRVRVRPMEAPAKREWRRPGKADKRKKVRKQGQNSKTRPNQATDKKGQRPSGSSQKQKTSEPQRKDSSQERRSSRGVKHQEEDHRDQLPATEHTFDQ